MNGVTFDAALRPGIVQPGGPPPRNGAAAGTPQVSFAEVLRNVSPPTETVRMSTHARQRLEERGITLSTAETARVGKAVAQAAAKGARETLVLMDKVALVVSVPNRTVITAMPLDGSSDTVVTNIDSAVYVSKDSASLKP